MTDLGGPACGVPLIVEEDEVDVWAAETVGSADVLVQQPVDQAAVACGQRSTFKINTKVELPRNQTAGRKSTRSLEHVNQQQDKSRSRSTARGMARRTLVKHELAAGEPLPAFALRLRAGVIPLRGVGVADVLPVDPWLAPLVHIL